MYWWSGQVGDSSPIRLTWLLMCQISLPLHRAPIVIDGDLRGIYENGVPQVWVKVL